MKPSILILMCAVFVFSSCSKSIVIEQPIGLWPDNIKLSTKNVDLNSTSDSVKITTGGTWWWLAGLTVNDSCYNFQPLETVSDTFIIKKESFVIQRRNKQTLFIKVDANPLKVQRVIKLAFEAGDYFDGVIITQKAKPNF